MVGIFAFWGGHLAIMIYSYCGVYCNTFEFFELSVGI